jgi:hypothetical protein
MSQSSMDRAYKIADELIKDKLRETAPELAAELDGIEEADILVVRGVHDHIQRVLNLAGTRFALVDSRQITSAELRPDQVMFINCGAKFDQRGLNIIRTFVEEGGFLFTTDWALRDVLEKAFPGYVEYNGQATGDDVVRVEIHKKDDPLLATLIGPDDDPQWWLEGSSYPIRVLKSDDVDVIISSKELGRKHGEPAVFVTFEVGAGRIYHMISHFYLQRTETRTARHLSSGDQYLDEKNISSVERAKYQAMGSTEANLAEVESAYTSRSMLSQVMLSKKDQMRRMRRERQRSPAQEEEAE